MSILVNDRSRQSQPFYKKNTEVLYIPTTSDPENTNYYYISLSEKPKESSVVINGYTEVWDFPNSDEFWVDYDAGLVYFSPSKAGSQVTITYYGSGSVIRAEDVNNKVEKDKYVFLGTNKSGASIPARKVVKIVAYDYITDKYSIEVVTDPLDKPLGITVDTINDDDTGEVLVFGVMTHAMDTSLATFEDGVYFDNNGDLTLNITGSPKVGDVINTTSNGVIYANFLRIPEGSGSAATNFLALLDTPGVYVGSLSGQHIPVVKSDGSGLEFKKLQGSDLFVEFNPNFNITVNGGPFDGLSYVEKGYSVPSVEISYSSNDAIEFPMTSPYIDNATLNGINIGLVSVTDASAYYNISFDESIHGSGFQADVHSTVSTAKSDTIDWRWRVFYGKSTNTTLNESQMESLTSSSLKTSKNGSYTFASGVGYLWFAWPTSFNIHPLGSFIDSNTGLNVGKDSGSPYTLVGVVNGYGASTDYYLYRSQYQIIGSITVSIS